MWWRNRTPKVKQKWRTIKHPFVVVQIKATGIETEDDRKSKRRIHVVTYAACGMVIKKESDTRLEFVPKKHVPVNFGATMHAYSGTMSMDDFKKEFIRLESKFEPKKSKN